MADSLSEKPEKTTILPLSAGFGEPGASLPQGAAQPLLPVS
jgi:hypothetical protein